MVCLLVLYGCKRQLLDPLNPQTNLPEKVKLDKVKGFYENGRYKNQPKLTSSNGNERMTAQDSARFKDFEPQWDKTEVENLPNNEKMIIVPVVRFLQVEYNQEIAFIRRLCIHIDENDDFLEANIVELIGNLTFVKNNYNAIFAKYKNTNILGFSGYVVVYEIDYDVITTKEYDNSTLKVTPCSSYPVYNEGGLYAIVDNCSGIITIIGTDGGEDTSGGDDGSGGPPSGGGTYNPVLPVPPCKGSACPKDSGVSWNLEEDMSDPISPEDSLKLAKYRKIVANTNGNYLAKDLKYAKILDSLRNVSLIVDSVYRKIEKNLATRTILTPGGNLTAKIRILHIVAVQGPAWAENFGITKVEANGIPTIKLGEKAGPEVFFEELTHALQYLERNTNVAATNDELVHMEFEAKIINHLIFGVDDGTELFKTSKSGRINYGISYKKWIATIKLENLSNFGAGEFCWTNFQMHIEYFATFPDPAYNTLQNPDFEATRLPTILFLLFR